MIVAIDHRRNEVEVAFSKEGRIRIPHEYLAAGHLEHGYARTTYGVQGATLDHARYHPSDGSRFEEGYVAITRATDSTNLYVVEGDEEVDDEHHAVEPEPTGLATVVEALGRRSDDELATARDPSALDVARLARTSTLQQLSERSRQLDAVLQLRPPSVARELADAQRTLAALRERHEAARTARPGWTPNSRRQAARTLGSLERAIDGAEHRVHELRAQQKAHVQFATAHQGELEERSRIQAAVSARRLTITVESVADPPAAVREVLGLRPAEQRDRLRWDRAVESAVVYADETGRHLPTSATTPEQLLGPPPENRLDRLRHRAVLDVLDQVHAPERARGVSLGI